MSVRLIITIQAKPGKGSELAKEFGSYCFKAQQEPGCEQFEVFQSSIDQDKVVLLERWVDQAALDVHAELNRSRPPLIPKGLTEGRGKREDYEYNRTR